MYLLLRRKGNFKTFILGLRTCSAFWDCFKLLLTDNCVIENINFTMIDIIFGNPTFDEMLNKLLLEGKQYIYRMNIEDKCRVLMLLRTLLHYSIKYISIFL